MFLLKTNTSKKFTFSTLVGSGKVAFSLMLDTSKVPVGEYILALFSGNSISSIPFTPVYTFLAKTTDATKSTPLSAPARSTNFRISFQSNKLFLTWT